MWIVIVVQKNIRVNVWQKFITVMIISMLNKKKQQYIKIGPVLFFRKIRIEWLVTVLPKDLRNVPRTFMSFVHSSQLLYVLKRVIVIK